uniref:Putative secreted protein n=1 Tax=Anopheles marajoara TaxID=58244 RepID=A0A2M4CD85_9DIPT
MSWWPAFATSRVVADWMRLWSPLFGNASGTTWPSVCKHCMNSHMASVGASPSRCSAWMAIWVCCSIYSNVRSVC